MTATGPDDAFEVIVTRDTADPGRLHYQVARVRRPGEDGDHLELLGDLGTPACGRDLAQQMALVWLRGTRPLPIAEGSVRFVWAVAEPDAEPARTVGGEVRYATVRRRWRLLRHGR